ncbi:MAG: sigma-70 family RNA polymerase sigma factor [Candidatus Poribacteria bacterium]|nr:sigma-70 family RNA polymerase sigma factor [Candidatus Poribacteria bacterium]
MTYDDSDLIQQTLEGDQQAFAALVEKYQKQIHALASQKIGDFHIAQEITQDAFFTAFQKLSTLTDPNRFAGWLYVITNRKCIAWHRKKSPQPQSLETTDPVELEEVYYSEYMTQQREEAANQKRRAVVQKLLSKLQESERTVVNMYYIAGMTCEDIGKFLGVSTNTVRSRLHRARNRLKKEEAMIQENLSSFQLPTQMTENIMKGISQLKPTTPSGSKPIVPLAVSAASAILVLLLMGVGAQNLIRFQKPYSIEATSKPSIEIVDAQIVLHSPTEPAARNQVGSSNANGQSNGTGQKPNTPLFAAAQIDDADILNSKQQWVQTKGPEGGIVATLFTTTRGDVYAGALSGLYRLTDDGQSWKLVNRIKDHSYTAQYAGKTWWPVVERQDALYLAAGTEILTSTDRGETWNVFCECIKGQLVGMVITDGIPDAQSDMAIYLAYTNGIFRTDNAGKSWTPLSDGMTDRKIHAIAAVENTIFAGTDKGLYRLKSENWEQVPVDGKVENIRALASAGHRLYAAVGKEVKNQLASQFLSMMTTQKASKSLYRSTDLGKSWKSIDPEKGTMKMSGTTTFKFSDQSNSESTNTVKIVAHQDNLLVINRGNNFFSNDSYYSNDSGNNWNILPISFSDSDSLPIITMLNKNTFYCSGNDGIYHTTNAGKTWRQLNTGLVNTFIFNLVAVNDTLYANIGPELVASSDGGESWTSVLTPVLGRTGSINGMVESNGVLYVKGSKKMSPKLYRLTAMDHTITAVPGMPIFEVPDFSKLMEEEIGNALLATLQEEAKTDLAAEKKIDPEQFDAETFNETYRKIVQENLNKSFQVSFGSFAVSGKTYYMESGHKLFRWKPGTAEWYDTGLVDEAEPGHLNGKFDDFDSISFKIAVSGDIVYVGKRDGHLMLSHDEGDIWNDVTAKLPFSVGRFNDITFAGQTVYVATDKGVIRSNNGLEWDTLIDTEGTPLAMSRLAVDDTTVYGEYNHKIYQLSWETDKWQQVTPEIPHFIFSFDVDGDTLYVGTAGRGVLRFTLDDSVYQ